MSQGGAGQGGLSRRRSAPFFFFFWLPPRSISFLSPKKTHRIVAGPAACCRRRVRTCVCVSVRVCMWWTLIARRAHPSLSKHQRKHSAPPCLPPYRASSASGCPPAAAWRHRSCGTGSPSGVPLWVCTGRGVRSVGRCLLPHLEGESGRAPARCVCPRCVGARRREGRGRCFAQSLTATTQRCAYVVCAVCVVCGLRGSGLRAQKGARMRARLRLRICEDSCLFSIFRFPSTRCVCAPVCVCAALCDVHTSLSFSGTPHAHAPTRSPPGAPPLSLPSKISNLIGPSLFKNTRPPCLNP